MVNGKRFYIRTFGWPFVSALQCPFFVLFPNVETSMKFFFGIPQNLIRRIFMREKFNDPRSGIIGKLVVR